MKIILKQDLVISEGTIFEDCAGENVRYYIGNYSTLIGTGKDGTINIIINEDVIRDNPDKFEVKE